jgi:tyrosine-protein kinase Etk/Wzc
VSLELAERLVKGVNQFNLETRKSQAAAERQFVEAQAAAAEVALREAEDRLQNFLQRNRETGGSPQLVFERDRLQRDVNLRQQLYSTLLQSREEAKIREVRDTPVITVIEPPRLPIVGESRKTIQKFLMGAFAGAVIGIFTALLAHGLSRARLIPSEEARQFFRLLEEATPRFMRRVER